MNEGMYEWKTTFKTNEGILKGTSCKGNRLRRVAPLEHLVCPEGHVALLMIDD
jgi:hypothetical protein